jgi:hypothetical protein
VTGRGFFFSSLLHHDGMDVNALRADLLTAPARGTEPGGEVFVSAEEGGYGMGTQLLNDTGFTAEPAPGATL